MVNLYCHKLTLTVCHVATSQSVPKQCFTNRFLRCAQLSDSAAFCSRKLSLDVHSRPPLARKSNKTENFPFIAWLLLLAGSKMSTLKKASQS
jgi:hypothetical protein